MFLLNSCLGRFSAAALTALLLPKLRSHFAEFLNNTSPAGLRILSSSTCVGLRYGPFRLSWDGFSCPKAVSLAPGFPFPAPLPFPCPRSSVLQGCRNLHLLSIGYASQPLLRPRLTQGRSALPWKPWIFGLKDSHLHLATHSGILSSRRSTAPSGTASAPRECSSTNLAVPRLRCGVSAPDIFGAGPLDQ